MSTFKLYPPFSKSLKNKDYILHDALRDAVEIALTLNQPLLLTGEPGTGKTKLAFKVAQILAEQDEHFLDKPFIFNTKTTSSANDLFYTYDALAHFQAANIKKEQAEKTSDTANYIELQALGKAIAQSNPSDIDQRKFKTSLDTKPMSSVVLIDEVDKAPRDFTNDILNEIENYHFYIKEQEQYKVQKHEERRILVLMTSNSEKNLPDAFLRRCVFYNIPFPNDDLLRQIIAPQLKGSTAQTQEMLDLLIKKFGAIRAASVRKKPATAELVAWVRMLELKGFLEADDKKRNDLILSNLSILVKTQEDLEAIKTMLAKL